MANSWRVTAALIRIDLLQGRQVLQNPVRDSTVLGVFGDIRHHIKTVFLEEESQRVALDPAEISPKEVFLERINRRSGRPVGDMALTALGLCDRITSRGKLSKEEESELSCFLQVFYTALQDHMAAHAA